MGPLPGLEFRPVTLMDLANQTVFEAILGETPAALRAAVASSVAFDQHAREFWQLVALEERRHAELAWATVAWAVQAGQVQVGPEYACRIHGLNKVPKTVVLQP